MKSFRVPVTVLVLYLVFYPSATRAVQPIPSTSAQGASSSASQDQSPLNPQTPQPGQEDSPFQKEHSWNHVALEFSGGFVPVTKKGAGYFNKGFGISAGVVDHLSPHWNVLLEAQFLGLNGSQSYTDSFGAAHSLSVSNTDFGMNLDLSYTLMSRSTSPYIIGGVGYYYLGPITSGGLTPGSCLAGCYLNIANAANDIGYNGGIGIRHKLFYGSQASLFAEARYHYIASETSAFGQLSMLPVSAGLRW